MAGLAVRLADLARYAVGLTAAVVLALTPVSLLAGAGLNGVKFGLFLAGTAAFGYATYLLWPSKPPARRGARSAVGEGAAGEGPANGPSARDGERPRSAGTGERPRSASAGGRPGAPDRSGVREESPFESLLGRLPVVGDPFVPAAERFHPGTKLYVASLLMLAVSYGMEALLGVRG